mmetsp:Transcript_3980/g.4104  ORF Transcript_3980/g.4104 Transcript_3980/m.4104 type:complete len:305 (+) Transcript_3980:89-1003(+)
MSARQRNRLLKQTDIEETAESSSDEEDESTIRKSAFVFSDSDSDESDHEKIEKPENENEKKNQNENENENNNEINDEIKNENENENEIKTENENKESNEKRSVLMHEIIVEYKKIFFYSGEYICLDKQDSIVEVAEYIGGGVLPQLHGDIGWLPEGGRRVGGKEWKGSNVGSLGGFEEVKEGSDGVQTTNNDLISLGKDVNVTDIDVNFDPLGELNQGISSLREEEKKKLMSNCNDLLAYLEVNVNPYITRGLIDVERNRPEDPIMYMIEMLESQSKKNQKEAEDNAYNKFLEILKESEIVSRF